MAVRGDEGRMLVSDMLQRVDKQTVTWRFPNGETYALEIMYYCMMSKVVMQSELRELKHLST